MGRVYVKGKERDGMKLSNEFKAIGGKQRILLTISMLIALAYTCLFVCFVCADFSCTSGNLL